MLNNSLFIPDVTYCTEVCGTLIKQIENLLLRQKKAIQIVNKAEYLEHTGALFQTLNTLPLFLLIELKIAIFIYKIYHRKMPLCILDYL